MPAMVEVFRDEFESFLLDEKTQQTNVRQMFVESNNLVNATRPAVFPPRKRPIPLPPILNLEYVVRHHIY